MDFILIRQIRKSGKSTFNTVINFCPVQLEDEVINTKA